MIKNMFKRTWLSIYRKPTKSIIMLLVLFVMANLVLASLSIKNAVNENIKYAKETLGSNVYLSADMEDMKQLGRPENGNAMFTRPNTNIEMVLDIADSKYVKDISYQVTAGADSYDFDIIEEEDTGFNMGRPGKPGNMNMEINVVGINSYAYISEVQNNVFEIDEGTYFDEKTEDGIIISYELASLNEFEVGDKLTLSNREEETSEYEIIGIFTSTESGYENSIYMNVESASKLMNDTMYNDGNYSVNNVIYYLTNPDDIDSFVNEASEKYDFEELSLTLDINTKAYDQMAGPIEQVGGFADTILYAVIISSIIIISLIVNNNIKDRTYEIGVLMSLGATKTNIIMQMFLEIVVAGTVGFILSMATSTMLANTISKSMLEDQISQTEESPMTQFGRPNFSNMKDRNQKLDVEVIDEIDVSVSLENYLLLFVLGYIVIFISMVIPSLNIVKYEPKTILSGRQ